MQKRADFDTYADDRAEESRINAAVMLEGRFTSTETMRARYHLALCEIGEPPLQSPSQVRMEEEINDLVNACQRSQRVPGEDYLIRVGVAA